VHQSFTLLDDRGQPQRFRLADWYKSDAADDPTKRLAIEQADSAVRRRLHRSIWVIGFLGGIAVPVLFFTFGAGSFAFTFTVMLGGMIGLHFLWPRIISGHLKRRPDGVTAPMLAQSLCPCCTYDLSQSAPEEDDCVVCNECGAAWKSTRRTNRDGVHPQPFSLTNRPGTDYLSIGGLVRGLRVVSGKDDTGRSVKFLVRRPMERSDSASRPELAVIQREVMERYRILRKIPIFLLAAMTYSFWQNSIIFAPGASPFDLLWGVFITVAFSYMFLWPGIAIWRGDVGVLARDARRIMLGADLCPACSADLDPAADDEGLITCRDCGCRWRCTDGERPSGA
jgi:hypothetical protein